MSAPTHEVEELTGDECRSLLLAHHVGRVAFAAGADVHVVPMTYVTPDGSTVVLRTSRTALLPRAAPDAVAFEIDGIDPRSRTGWSVCVHGSLREVDREAVATLDGDAAALRAWAPGERDVWLLIVPSTTTGRRLALGEDDARRWYGGVPMS